MAEHDKRGDVYSRYDTGQPQKHPASNPLILVRDFGV